MPLFSLETRALSRRLFPLLQRRRVRVAVESSEGLLLRYCSSGVFVVSFLSMESEYPNLVILKNKVAA